MLEFEAYIAEIANENRLMSMCAKLGKKVYNGTETCKKKSFHITAIMSHSTSTCISTGKKAEEPQKYTSSSAANKI